MTSNENSICAASLLTTKSLFLSLLVCFEHYEIMRCDHKLIFHNFLLTNINNDAFLLTSLEANMDNSGQRQLTKTRLIPVCIEILNIS